MSEKKDSLLPPKQAPRFPVAIRKMWSGTEVQAWLDANYPSAVASPDTGEKPPVPTREQIDKMIVSFAQERGMLDTMCEPVTYDMAIGTDPGQFSAWPALVDLVSFCIKRSANGDLSEKEGA